MSELTRTVADEGIVAESTRIRCRACGTPAGAFHYEPWALVCPCGRGRIQFVGMIAMAIDARTVVA